ncbi:chemotaxis protein CheW [Salinilacihabitans rarus]|uniref:chemotaxis protein CheW n=1 Tax=Salinilacihabitans rarus TaxID=2961596 RepID=UPI0020C86D77|nr:chemotaxis protein CheW [Salinilacihabitans rarus]
MSADLPEKLLGIDIDDSEEQREGDDEPEEELERFLFFSIGERRLAVSVDEVKTIVDPPTSPTRVPRSPEAITGVVDLRGEITAVIEPRELFPAEAAPSDEPRLVVFDRPTDRQPAAMIVDEVRGVESVPESDVRDPDEVAADVAGGALEHPLVVGLVERERADGTDAGRIVVEVTPLVDVDRLLLAAGRPA